MNSADRAVAILRAGLGKPMPTSDGGRKGVNPFAPHSKCEFARWLNDRPFPAKYRRLTTSTRFGSWLHDADHAEFERRYQEWRAKQ